MTLVIMVRCKLLRNTRNTMQESIYNIVPKQRPMSAKTPRYQSKYPPHIPPTSSTFCIKTTSKPGVANVAGQIAQPIMSHSPYGEAKTLGYVKGQRRPVQELFRLKHTGTMGDNSLPQPNQFEYDCTLKKSPVPKVNQKPVQGLRSSKNFVVANAVENILSVPKVVPSPVDWTKKKNFGKVPDYINRIKEDLEQDKAMMQKMRREQSDDRYSLSGKQVETLQTTLCRRWEQVNKEYQATTHISKVDSVGLKRRRVQCESELNQLEADIKKLGKIQTFVRTNNA